MTSGHYSAFGRPKRQGGELHLFNTAVGTYKELGAALKHVDAATKDVLTDVHIEGEHTEHTVHTLPNWHIHGTAQADGHAIEWVVSLVQHGDHVLLIIGFATHEGLQKHADDATTVFASAVAK